MSYPNCASHGQSFAIVCRSFLQAEGLPFSDALSEEVVEQAFSEEGALFGQEKGVVYTPAITLWAFLSQVIQSGAQRSCNAAVDRVGTLCVLLGLGAPSPDSGAYWRARAKLSEDVLQRLTYHVADELVQRLPREWLWYGRHVFSVDGTTVTAPDTPANQAAWPQQTSQQPGLGFPLLRLCALLSMVTGAVQDIAFGPYQGKETGETALLRSMFDRLRRGDVLLGIGFFPRRPCKSGDRCAARCCSRIPVAPAFRGMSGKHSTFVHESEKVGSDRRHLRAGILPQRNGECE